MTIEEINAEYRTMLVAQARARGDHRTAEVHNIAAERWTHSLKRVPCPACPGQPAREHCRRCRGTRFVLASSGGE